MHKSSCFALIVAVAMLMNSMFGPTLAVAAGARASAKPATYDLIYIEVARKDISRTIALLRSEETSGRKGAGNLGFLALQRLPEVNQFLIVGLWTDHASLAAYQTSKSTQQFRAALQPWLIGPYDERPNIGFLTNAVRDQAVLLVAPKSTVFVFAHIDIDPEDKAIGMRAIADMFPESKDQPGNFTFDVLNQASRTNHFTLFEAWQSRASFTAYKERKFVRRFRDALLPIMGSIYEGRLYQKIG